MRSVILATLMGACSVESIVSTTEPETGPGTVYALASTNDRALPTIIVQDETRVEIRKGALTLGPDSTFIFSIAVRTSFGGSQPSNGTTTIRGELKRDEGSVIALVQATDTMFVGTYSPNAVTLDVVRARVSGDRFVFVR